MINLNALSPDRFQHLAQVLLLEDFPDLQCLPTGQPDGGRDGVATDPQNSAGSSVVLQVKFRIETKKSTFEWVTDTFTREIGKAAELKKRGVARYVIASNAHVSTHLDTGEFDRINQWFADNFPLPVRTFWLEDLERRFERSNVGLKLEYPSVLTGEHAILLLLNFDQDKTLARVRKAFIAMTASEFARESRVRFQQVELDADLAKVYVELPYRHGTKQRSELSMAEDSEMTDDYWSGASEIRGVAQYLLAESSHAAKSVYLEGGPGQGKSTVTQFVAQVQRAKMLGDATFLEAIAPELAEAPFRVPARVDLRQFATAVRGETSPRDPLTLETYLARVLTAASGGMLIDVDDLVTFATSVPMSFLFDGLDEVADLDMRSAIVDVITSGVLRLRANGADLQVVITSRPSVLTSPVSLKDLDIQLLRLTPLRADDVIRYARKWVRAQALTDAEGEDIVGLLLNKVTEDHVAELTRSPMQLAIFLSLLLTKGEALPELRTELYREYVGLFMTREAVKNSVVRTHQKLIIQIVQYLAFVLQADAEAHSGSGTIALDSLRTLIARYLTDSGNDSRLLDELFNFGLERVYVLTHRVEGLYEFEVQPLREYFAAEHLYETAPVYSTRVVNSEGDKSQRFEALLYRPYWFNTMRFYGGFYTGGEVGALHASLMVLGRRSVALQILARSTGVALLVDWVFRVKRPVQSIVIHLTFDQLGIALAESSVLIGSDSPSLAPQCGRDELRDLIMSARFSGVRSRDIDQRSVLFLIRNGGRLLDLRAWVVEEKDDRFGRLALAKAILRDPNYLSDIDSELSEAGLSSPAQVLLSAIDIMPGLARQVDQQALAQAIMDEGPTHATIRLLNAGGAVNSLAGGRGISRIEEGAPISEELFEAVGRLRSGAVDESVDEVNYRLWVLRKHFGNCVGLWTAAASAIARGGKQLISLPSTLNDDVFREMRECVALLDEPGLWADRFQSVAGPSRIGWILSVLCFGVSRLDSFYVELELAVDALDEATYRRCERSAYSWRRLRRRLPGTFGFESIASVRLGLLLAILSSPREMEAAAQHFPAESDVAVVSRRQAARVWLTSFQGWGTGSDSECLARLREVAVRSRTAWLATPLSTRSLQDMPLGIAEEIIGTPLLYSREVLGQAVSVVIAHHEAESRSVLAIAEEQKWELL